MHFGTITTLLACTARSTVPRQRNAPVQNPLLLLRLINTLGSSIAVGCFKHRSPPDCEFATHNLIRVVVEDVQALQRFIVQNLSKIRGVANIRSSFALKQVKYSTALPLRTRTSQG